MLNISIVLYKTPTAQLMPLLEELHRIPTLHRIYLVDNSPKASDELASLPLPVVYIYNDANLGYGRAHNIAIRESVYDEIAYHLVINSDIEVKAEAVEKLLAFMDQHREVGHLMPRVVYPNGEVQYVAKLLPTPLDVFGRRFLPKRWMEKRNAQYELRFSGYDKPMNVPYLSGCFMLLRTEAVLQARLFDERYFMYPEDIDLTRTIHRDWLTLYLPSVTVIHHHAKSSYHSLRYLWIHIINMCRYFNKWGWFSDTERDVFNKQLLEYLSGKSASDTLEN